MRHTYTYRISYPDIRFPVRKDDSYLTTAIYSYS